MTENAKHLSTDTNNRNGSGHTIEDVPEIEMTYTWEIHRNNPNLELPV